MYESATAAGAGAGPGAGPGGGGTDGGQQTQSGPSTAEPGGKKVEDATYEVVDDKDKKGN